MNPQDHFIFVPNAISAQQAEDFSTNLSSSPASSWSQLKRRRLILAGACPNPQQTQNQSAPCIQTKIEPWITGSLLETVNKKIIEIMTTTTSSTNNNNPKFIFLKLARKIDGKLEKPPNRKREKNNGFENF